MAQSTRPPRPPEPPSEHLEEWRRRHAEELASGHKPRFCTSGGAPVEPLYTPEGLQAHGWDHGRDIGYPGEAPFVSEIAIGESVKIRLRVYFKRPDDSFQNGNIGPDVLADVAKALAPVLAPKEKPPKKG